MGLFKTGEFTLHSGAKSPFKIECDSLDDEDLNTLAMLIENRVAYFTDVEGVPSGGWRLAQALKPYVSIDHHVERLLIVDDVLTSGASMEEHRAGRDAVGVVLFARGPCPRWIFPLFTMEEGY